MSGDLDLAAKALQLVEEAAGKDRPAYGHITCPKCGGRLYYALLGNRSHKGECTTPACLKWIG